MLSSAFHRQIQAPAGQPSLHTCCSNKTSHHGSTRGSRVRVSYRREGQREFADILARHARLSSVPVIDAAELLHKGNADSPPSADVVSQITAAASEWGFFQLVNHGVSQQLLDAHYEATKRFFQLPREDKLGLRRSASTSMGWFDDEYTKRRLDVKQCFDFRHVAHPHLPDSHPLNFDPQGVNQWPEGDAGFRDIQTRYAAEMERVAFRLLEAFALGVGLTARGLHHLFEERHTSFLRLNFYPVTPEAPPDALGISEHKDAGFLTVLLQDDVPGLQVLRGGVWHLVEPQAGALTINVGDMAQVLSNDHFTASNHRVLKSSSHDRYSRAYFFNPLYSADVQPLASLAAADGGPRYRPINWREFRMQRFAGDYADVGEEVQIDWYRLDSASGAAP